MTPEQCRAGRGWLGLSQAQLAEAASVGLSTVKDFEAGKRVPIAATLGAMRAALERSGIGFTFVDDGTGKPRPCGITFSVADRDHTH